MNDIKYYTCYYLLKKGLPIWFVFLIYLIGKGLTFTEALFLDSVSAGITMLLEVPSGMMADLLSKKKLMLFGEILIGANYVFLLLGNNYIIFLMGAALSGIGEAFISGTSEALLYNKFSENERKEKYILYASFIQKWGMRIAAISTLFSSFLYSIFKELPIIISIIMQGVAFICLLFIKEQRRERKETKEIVREKNHFIKILKNRNLIKLFFIYIIMMEIISNINYSSQSYLPQIGLDVKFLGVVFFFFNIVSSFGAKISSKIKLKGIVLVLIYGIILILLSFSNLYMGILILSVSRYINGFIWPVLSNEINRQIEEKNRATILSYRSLMAQVFPLLADPMIGASFDKFGIGRSYALLGEILIAVVILFFIGKVLLQKPAKR